MTLKDFLHFPGNPSISFFTRPADVPMSIGSPAGFATNVPDEELDMAIAALVANNAVGAKVVPPSAGRRWRGVVVRPVGSPQRVIALSLDVDSKGKRITFLNSAGSPSFKEKKHVVLDEGPSSPKLFLTLFHLMKLVSRRLVLHVMLFETSPILMSNAILMERTSLGRDFFPHAVERLLSSNHHSYALANLLEKAMLVCRSQYLREVASSGIGVELVDMKDFDLNAEQNYDRAIESFY
nr:hypothetical protein [Tanacetum cinerariifolium]